MLQIRPVLFCSISTILLLLLLLLPLLPLLLPLLLLLLLPPPPPPPLLLLLLLLLPLLLLPLLLLLLLLLPLLLLLLPLLLPLPLLLLLLLFILLLRYNSGTVVAFSTISFHLRRFWTCSSHFMFHLSQVVPDVFPSGLRSSHSSSCRWFPFVYFPCNTGFRHSIHVSKPTQSLGFNIIDYVPMFY